MPKMSPQKIKNLRSDVADTWIEIQNKYKNDIEPAFLIPEMIATFTGISWFVAREHLKMEKEDFLDALKHSLENL